jgi:phytoene/squalene synthetase
MLNSFDAASLRLLAQKVNTIIDVNSDALARGNGYIPGDTAATAQNYCSSINYIRALNDVLGLCQEVEDELLGRNQKKEQGEAA